MQLAYSCVSVDDYWVEAFLGLCHHVSDVMKFRTRHILPNITFQIFTRPNNVSKGQFLNKKHITKVRIVFRN